MRGLGGFKPWLLQRLSALYLLGFLGVVGVKLVVAPVECHADWIAWLASPLVWMATAVFFVALLLHAWVGLRDVILDYVKPDALRFAVLVGAAGGLMALAMWSARVMIKVVS